MNRSFIVKNIFKYIAGFLLLGLLSCSDSGNSSSPEETSKAICIGNAFERNKTITAILDECSVSINDILEANIEGINLSSCSRNDVISHSDKTILELSAECGEIVPISSSSASEKACYYPETEQCFEGDYTVCPGAGGELMDQCPSTGDVSSSSGTTESSSSSLEQEFKYCVFEADKTCLQGTEPVTECPPGGDLSNSCPYGASSSSTKGESSSSATTPFSSSSGKAGNYFTDLRDGQQYRIVQIGDQLWMRDNLNYSKDETVGYCYGVDINGSNPHRDSSSCDNGYGRSYRWEEAMNGTSEQGLCPNGWRLPSATELEAIMNKSDFFILAGNYNLNANYPPLGWKARESEGLYWSNTSNSYRLYVGRTYGANVEIGASSDDYFSVRCMTDGDIELPCGNSAYSFGTEFCHNNSVYEKCGGSSYNPAEETCENGRVLVPSLVYSGQTYKAVRIGEQTWMAENLNYETVGSWCYNDLESFCDTYGRLYSWEAAMAGEESIEENVQGVCPDGWHLPSVAEWETLVNEAGVSKLQSKDWGGTDDYGFNALPSGNYSEGDFTGVSSFANWWTATTISYTGNMAGSLSIGPGVSTMQYRTMDSGFSVRCVKD